MSPVTGHVIERSPTVTIRSRTPVAASRPPPATYPRIARVSAKSAPSSWTSSGRNPAAMIATAPSPPLTRPSVGFPARRRWTRSEPHAHARGTTITTPSTWHCIVTMAPMPLAIHHRAWPDRRAITAPAYARAEAAGIRFGFQMNVDSSMPAGEIAARSPAAAPASGPPTSRASHHVAATAAIPNSAISPVTTTGSAEEITAAGASR